MIDELFRRFDGAFSNNTIRAYRADFTHYQGWCAKQGTPPLPPNGPHLANYVDSMAGDLSLATIQRRIASLGSLFRLMELDDPTKGADCAIAVKRARRQYGAPQKQATPLTIDLLKALQATCDPSLVGQRDRLLLQLGYETLRRRSEIVRFRFDDVLVTPLGTHRLILRRSKTDQFGQGKQLPISKLLASLITNWQRRVSGASNYLLPKISGAGAIGTAHIAPNQVNQILQARQRQAGLALERPLSGHSFRVGGALDLLKRGVSMEKIMLRGGWKSESSALRYLREWVGDDVLVWDEGE